MRFFWRTGNLQRKKKPLKFARAVLKRVYQVLCFESFRLVSSLVVTLLFFFFSCFPVLFFPRGGCFTGTGASQNESH